MSSEFAIKVEKLSKCYHIYDEPRHRLLQIIFRGRKRFYREFWALRDVSFEVKKGETVGIIGGNGSGKSTLLQMISGTLNPTGGFIQTHGRIAALLELGSGFNPEFTGRENVYLNATVLGLTREEIDCRFVEIADFADIGDFMDQPVKTYSSGMYVRLAFAISVYVDPEVLIIDEALAVGDIQFQMKCIDRMEEIRLRGTTILFVSHSLDQVKRFCTSAIWIDKGSMRLTGDANYVCDRFRDSSMLASVNSAESDTKLTRSYQNKTDSPAIISSVDVSATSVAPFDPLTVRIKYSVIDQSLPRLLAGVAIMSANGAYVFGPNTHLEGVLIPQNQGTHVIEYSIPKLPLLTGTYLIDVGLFSDAGLVCLDYISSAAKICVVAGYFSEGLVYIEHEWKIISN